MLTPERARTILDNASPWPYWGNTQSHMTKAEYEALRVEWLADKEFHGSLNGFLARIAYGERT